MCDIMLNHNSKSKNKNKKQKQKKLSLLSLTLILSLAKEIGDIIAGASRAYSDRKSRKNKYSCGILTITAGKFCA